MGRGSNQSTFSGSKKLTWLKYFSEYWYMGSISASWATTKYSTEPLVATDRYFSRAIEIFSSVASVSTSRASMMAEVS